VLGCTPACTFDLAGCAPERQVVELPINLATRGDVY
jgi:hypothetical protein